ncbi:uracil phosphoribosyltransferase [Eurytemora carolleeae]|uniref:uracil phosphoribosyltransferase n=1 Tax=Eurytemora carolleeae TaxID=1294199 RepID=UPI000C780A81|nr:uracil phosphoribosyltransferase [Eurytemora carolleeae]|eukprot:XP_023321455.1 uracil phosphoribosyltransferase-like [Eurytemora affinis]
MAQDHPNLTVVESRAVSYLLLKLRNKDTKADEFQRIGDRMMRILGEEALCRLPSVVEGEVQTPCGTVTGPVDSPTPGPPVCIVSIVRSGDILQEAVRVLSPGFSVGKILIQRDESREDKPAVLYYKKLPKNINQSFVLLVDPMLATAGSAIRAIQVLKENGVSTQNIMFLNLICCPEGLQAMAKLFPEIHIITGCVDSHLNEDKYIVPGLGDYGDRYYGTE